MEMSQVNTLGKSHETIQQSYSFKRLMADVLGETDFWAHVNRGQPRARPHFPPTQPTSGHQPKQLLFVAVDNWNTCLAAARFSRLSIVSTLQNIVITPPLICSSPSSPPDPINSPLIEINEFRRPLID